MSPDFPDKASGGVRAGARTDSGQNNGFGR
jgi:hypothetical protein